MCPPARELGAISSRAGLASTTMHVSRAGLAYTTMHVSTSAVSARTCRTGGANLTKPPCKPLCKPLCCELNLYAAQYRPERVAPAGQKGGMKRQPAAVEVEEEEEVVMLGGGSTDDSDEEEEKSVNYDMWGGLDSAAATGASSCQTKPPTACYICCYICYYMRVRMLSCICPQHRERVCARLRPLLHTCPHTTTYATIYVSACCPVYAAAP